MQTLNHVTAIALICWLLCCLIFIDVCIPWPNDVAVLDQRMWFWLRFELNWWCMPLSLFLLTLPLIMLFWEKHYPQQSQKCWGIKPLVFPVCGGQLSPVRMVQGRNKSTQVHISAGEINSQWTSMDGISMHGSSVDNRLRYANTHVWLSLHILRWDTLRSLSAIWCPALATVIYWIRWHRAALCTWKRWCI